MNTLFVILINIFLSTAAFGVNSNGSAMVEGNTFDEKGQITIAGHFGQTPGQTSDTSLANYWFGKAEAFAETRNYDSANVYFNNASEIYKKAENWERFVQCLNSIGINTRRTGDFETAKPYLEKALETGLKELGKVNLEVAKSYYNLGVVYSRQSNYEKAIEYLEESLSIRVDLLGENHPDVASIYNTMGSVYYADGNYNKTLEYLFQSLSIQLETIDDDSPKIISSYNNIGLTYLEKGDFKKATEYFNKSLDIIIQTSGEDDPKNAGIYSNIGNAYYAKGDFDKALEYYYKSLSIKLKSIGEENAAVANAYNNIGLAYIKKRDFDKAFEYLNKALSIKLKTDGDSNPSVASYYSNIGLAYIEKGDYNKALEYYNKSLSIRLKLFGGDHPDVSTNYHNIGNAYYFQGAYDKALDQLNIALSIRLELLDEKHINVATSYNSIGLCYLEKDEYDKALEYFNKSLTVARELFGDQHLRIVKDYNSIGLVYIEKGDYDVAFGYFNKSLEILSQLDGANAKELAYTYNQIGIASAKNEDYNQALSYFQKALQSNVKGFASSKIYDNPPLEGMISEKELESSLYQKAKTLAALYENKTRNLDDLRSSVFTYQHTFLLIDKMRNGYKAEGSKLILAENTALYAEEAINTALQLYEANGDSQFQDMAFTFAEKNKAGVLYESVSESNARQFSGIPNKLLQKEKQLRIDLAFYETQIQKNELDSLTSEDFEARLFKLKQDYGQMINLLDEAYPAYYKMKYDYSVANIEEIQNKLQENNEGFIEYFLGEGYLFTIAINKDKTAVVRQTIDSKFYSEIEMYLNLVQSYNVVQLKHRSQFFNHSRGLYNMLIRPVEQIINNCNKLVIIPDNILNGLPFETLISSTENPADFDAAEYLLKRFAISYHFSATLYQNTKGPASDELAYKKQWSGYAPVFSDGSNYSLISTSELKSVDPDYKNVQYRAVSDDGKHFNPLPYSEHEVKSIDKIFAGQMLKSDTYLNEQASEKNFKTLCGDYKYLHLATHSIVNHDTPKLSGIIFSPPENIGEDKYPISITGNADDGILYAGEIYNLMIDANLVVLSSCESGIGSLAKGEGMMALTRALLYAGAQNQIASLWKVEDKSSAALMISFYDLLLSGKPIPEALRGAKLKMIEQNVPPVFWGAYVLTGE